jgi:14-3-3 protein epsilon
MAAELLAYQARIAEQAEMFGEMKETMKELAKLGHPLSEDERNLLSVAYKNVVGQKRTSWRIICSMESKTPDQERITVCQKLREKIENELKELCDEIIDLLQNYLLKNEGGDQSDETAVFFYKMKGDYLRYKVEVTHDDYRDQLSNESREAYELAAKVAEKLPPTHPIRLGLALNFSVYYYEIANNPEEACNLAKQAFDLAMAELDKTSEDSYKDSTLIMQLLRDNLTLWNEKYDNDQ